MYENEVQKAQERLNAALSLAKQQPDEAINMIEDMLKWVKETLPNDCPEFYGIVITYNEVMGDLRHRVRKFVEAEGYYKSMVNYSKELYELDKEKYDLRLANAYAKLANNCRTCINCNVFSTKPMTLTEMTQRPFDAGMNFYKAAITVINDNAKKGSGKHLEFRAQCIVALAVMNAAIGNYKDSINMFKDAVSIYKAIYQALDNVASGTTLGNTLSSLATVYSLYKDAENAADCLEDSIYVLLEHEKEDPVRSGVLIARNYMNLAGCYVLLKNDQEDIDGAYDKATQKISMANALGKNTAVGDEITCYMLCGQYYVNAGNTDKGKKKLEHAYDLAKDAAEKNPNNKQFALMRDRIASILGIKSEEADK